MRTLVIALALVSTACTTRDLDHVWARPDASVPQMTYDDWQCHRVAYDTAPRTPELYIGGLADLVRVEIDERNRIATYGDCMRSRGYTRVQ